MPTPLPAPDLLPVFNALPGANLLLSPEWVIVGASDDYLAATLTQRATLVGQFIFDAFPDNPQAPEANAVASVRASLQQVLATRQPHEMAPQHYDVPDPARPGQFVERHWQPRHTPVLDAAGQVQFIIQSVQDITASRLAERRLHESRADEQVARAEAELQRQQLYNVLQQAPAMICIFDGPQHTFQFVNPPYQALVGERPLVGKPIAEAMPELADQPIFGLLDQVYQSGETFYAHEMLVQLDHQNEGRPELEKRYYNFIYQARHSLAGVVDGILVFAYDVTTQVLARQQVEHTQQQVQSLNEELAASNEELRASNEEYLATNTALQEAQQQLAQLNQELEVRIQDRTADLQRARQAAVGQQQRLERLFRQAPAAVCILDGPNLVFELVNSSYQQLFPGRVLLGKPLLAALPELADQPVWHTLRQVYATGETHQELGIRIPVAPHEGGALQDFYFNYIQQARFDEQGRVDGILVFAFEVTEQVIARQQVEASQLQVHGLNQELAAINEELTATNEELHESNTRLTRTNADLDTFVYTASHDLKAPITNIEAILLALRDNLPPTVQQDEVVAHLLGLFDHTVGRFRTTIDQLTDLSRLQQTYNEPAERLALAPVVADVVADLAPVIQVAGATLHLAVPADLRVSFAPASLRSVVYNLLSNAVKYCDPARPAQVWLRAERQAEAVVLTVRDNGLGLSEVQQQRLFKVFQRLHTHVEGTGVGLYMIKRLIENAGGRISVVSEPGEGSTFTVAFPQQ